MRLLLFSDLHCDDRAARHLVERSRTADVVVGAGDFGSVRRGIDICIDVLKAIACPAIVVPGNNESLEELVAACQVWPQAHV
ncbi:MAG: metallophosphatase family protein, partial [Armatimonadota bacterium]|nr:metallophosphatase family protein [Armatimonadota bacterium]